MTLERIVTEPLLIARVPRRERSDVVHAAAARVGLTADLLTRRPHQVSDGQLQRACLARALVQRPRYLICDEMTAMLDPATTAAVVAVLREETRAGLGVLAVSHDHELWARGPTMSSNCPSTPPRVLRDRHPGVERAGVDRVEPAGAVRAGANIGMPLPNSTG